MLLLGEIGRGAGWAWGLGAAEGGLKAAGCRLQAAGTYRKRARKIEGTRQRTKRPAAAQPAAKCSPGQEVGRCGGVGGGAARFSFLGLGGPVVFFSFGFPGFSLGFLFFSPGFLELKTLGKL